MSPKQFQEQSVSVEPSLDWTDPNEPQAPPVSSPEFTLAEDHLRALIGSSSDSIWSVDLDYRLVSFNPTLALSIEAEYGCAPQIGMRLYECFPPERAQHWPGFFARALREGHFGTEYRIEAGRILDLSFNRIESGGTVLGISVLGREITAERSMHRTHQLLASIVEASDDALLTLNLSGAITTWNPGAERIFGYPGEEIVGRNILRLVAPADSGRINVLFSGVSRGLSIGPLNLMARHKDGTNIDASLMLSPICDELGRVVASAASLRDHRQQRLAERQLRDSEDRYRSTFEQAAIGIVHLGFDGVIQRCNLRMASMLGYRANELAGKTFAALTAPEDLDLSMETFRTLLNGELPSASFEKRYLHKKGHPVWVRITISPQRDSRRRPIHLLSFVEDISEHKLAETRLSSVQLALQISEARYRLAFQNTLDAVLITRLSDGLYVECNLAFIDILGYTRQEIIGQTSLDLGIWANPADRDYVKQTLSRGEVVRNRETLFSRKDGSTLWGQFSASCIEIDGQPHILSLTRDISAAKEAEMRLKAATHKTCVSEERYRAVFASSFDGILIIRRDNQAIVDANPRFEQAIGYTRDELMGQTAVELGIWADPAERDRWLRCVEQTRGCHDFEVRLRHKNGEELWNLLSATEIELEGVSSLMILVRDISAAKAAADEIRNLAFFDPLTGLPNRRLLLEQLNQTLEAEPVPGHAHHRALLFVDLDNFKTLNDTLGHQAGDQLLQEVARRLVSSMRPTDVIARLGGDEFVLLLNNLGPASDVASEQASAIASQVLAEVSQPYTIDGRACSSTCSIGITVFGSLRISSDDLLKQADIAMYEAKSAGRNTLHFFAPSLEVALNARASIEEEMRSGLVQREFVLFYQPQIEQGRLIGAEALVRWEHPSHGLLQPGEFIQIAEESGLIVQLGQQVLEMACEQLAKWAQRPDTAHLITAVNISPLQLREPGFVHSVLDALQSAGANPARLNLELTESLLVEGMEEVIGKMTQLRTHGIKFSLDDFGTGYSSLAYLKRLPLNHLKIDRAFIRDILADKTSVAIAQTILALSRAMNLNVIAEGVETQEQCNYLLNMGCTCFQGYLFGRPLPLAEFESRWLDHGRKMITSAAAPEAWN